ncbi:MAG: DUF4920 domain-containing protein [Bacteroidetes bacterium]|nr:DUF4920 domain-containing protein [Bacteroidota bacterium]MBU1116605.1 DUF4920 domain-containing protein [Bacteroidota bacterium]MBU1797722.1 DUF4920 domain-containing protein [Bacteroidota bacterium]
MQKYLVMFAFTILLSANLIAKDVTKYGKEITAKEKVKVSEILEKPDSFVGKKVLVEGTILNVCEKRGCWIELASDKEFESIRVKVEDGVIVFPMEAKGQKALVEGEVVSFTVEADGAECSGTDCKDEEKEKKEDCKSEKKHVKTVYQIQGIGAEI